MKLPVILQNRPYRFWITVSILLTAIVAFVDYLTGVELSFSLFYLIPISVLTWFTKRSYGIAGSMVGCLVWLLVNIRIVGSCYDSLTHVWNSLIRLTFFLIVTFLLSSLKASLEREQQLARTDYLTGAINARAFYEYLQKEIDRCQRFRNPFSVAYLDLDNFKQINDRFGHTMGDHVLSTIVKHTLSHLRKTDIFARIGGDEFVLLLPGTDAQAAQVVMSKIKEGLVTQMRNQEFAITCSIGVITCTTPPSNLQDLITTADNLMYEVKRDGKNDIYYLNWLPT